MASKRATVLSPFQSNPKKILPALVPVNYSWDSNSEFISLIYFATPIIIKSNITHTETSLHVRKEAVG